MLDLNKEMMIDKMKNYPYNKREGTLKTEGIMQIFITLVITRLVFIFTSLIGHKKYGSDSNEKIVKPDIDRFCVSPN